MQEEKALQLVSLAQAQKLKELGFDYSTIEIFNGSVADYSLTKKNHNDFEFPTSRPTVSLALKWFRNVRGIENAVETRLNDDWTTNYDSMWWHPKDKDGEYFRVCGIEFPTYGEAESALLDALLEYCENNKQEKQVGN